GFWATIRLAAAASVLSLVIGTLLASFRVAPIPVLRAFGTGYVSVVRNTPLTLVLLMCSLGLNDILALKFSSNSSVTYYWWAVLGLSAYTGAFVCETLRSGINTVPLGQAEAARSVGLTFTQSLRMIILPQAFRAIIAP
ncbi:ABC transporter permease subunit, partial [Micromonospora aurantiaca]|nr:ABC transporter permease subunit [Micromonospora aurantiaca]